MAYKLLFYVVACLCLVLTCSATMYTVGDTSGWDISSDLDSWVKNKTFNVGDVLYFRYGFKQNRLEVFQYSSSYTVNEVTRENFNGCNVTQAMQIYTGGNTTIPLTKPDDRFFVPGNKLYCLGGMKLQVDINGDQGAGTPASAPGLAPQASTSQNNNVPPKFSASDESLQGGRNFLVAACLGVFVILLSVAII